MAHSRRFPRQSRFPTRRLTSWDSGVSALPLTLGVTANQIWTVGQAVTVEKTTLIRIRGTFMAFLTAVTAGGDGFDGAFGIGVVSSEAFAAGVASIPSALSDSDRNIWLVHQFINLHQLSGTETDGSNAVGSVVRGEIDSKSMRKLVFGDVVFGSLELVEQGTAAGEFFANTRFLAKLS